MDPEDIDIDELDPEPGETPDYRVTVQRSGLIRAVTWAPWFASSGPLYTLLAARERAGVAIADVTVVRDDDGRSAELIVDFQCGGAARHRDGLREWAAAVGYRRIWFDREVIELEPTPGGFARTRCSGCGVALIDGKAGFWAYTRRSGAFPTSCALCGCDLPQWVPAPLAVERRLDTPTSTGTRSPASR